jgi:hypothetical protein
MDSGIRIRTRFPWASVPPVGEVRKAPEAVPWGTSRMVQKKADPTVIRAAAALLESDPGISNLRILQRLAALLGPGVTRDIPVTRVERMVREPALLLIRMGATNGAQPASAEPPPSPTPRAPVAPTVGESSDSPSRPRRRARPRARPRVTDEDVDAALGEAFALGATAESPQALVEAFRKLEALRRRLRTGGPPGR